jgi:hypothetical protein
MGGADPFLRDFFSWLLPRALDYYRDYKLIERAVGVLGSECAELPYRYPVRHRARRRPGKWGVYGNRGNVLSITYGRQRNDRSSIPTSRPNQRQFAPCPGTSAADLPFHTPQTHVFGHMDW